MKKKWFKNTSIILLSLILISVFAFLIYVSNYYKADKDIKSAISTAIADNQITDTDDLTIFHSKDDSGSALIFYPGGKVESSAYEPLLSNLAKHGITCVLVKMPFHLAVFDVNAADQVYDKLPDIKNWYIGGHSLGGAMASSYMSKHQDKLKGLILLGAYIYGDIDSSKALTIYGSNDQVLDRKKITYDKNIVVIEGGNHAGFGNYGAQKGDGTATITREEQQNITTKAIVDFILR